MDAQPLQAIDSTSVNPLTNPSALKTLNMIEDPKQKAEAIAGQLESVFFGMMVKAMRATVPEGGLLGKGLGGKHYIDMLDQQFAELGALPRDPRFHEALVREIMQSPESATRALSNIGNTGASTNGNMLEGLGLDQPPSPAEQWLGDIALGGEQGEGEVQ